jgi:predicted NAD-dependent protein-ADP-ribosyltransferase YbiA (DUF1768 family)
MAGLVSRFFNRLVPQAVRDYFPPLGGTSTVTKVAQPLLVNPVPLPPPEPGVDHPAIPQTNLVAEADLGTNLSAVGDTLYFKVTYTWRNQPLVIRIPIKKQDEQKALGYYRQLPATGEISLRDASATTDGDEVPLSTRHAAFMGLREMFESYTTPKGGAPIEWPEYTEVEKGRGAVNGSQFPQAERRSLDKLSNDDIVDLGKPDQKQQLLEQLTRIDQFLEQIPTRISALKTQQDQLPPTSTPPIEADEKRRQELEEEMKYWDNVSRCDQFALKYAVVLGEETYDKQTADEQVVKLEKLLESRDIPKEGFIAQAKGKIFGSKAPLINEERRYARLVTALLYNRKDYIKFCDSKGIAGSRDSIERPLAMLLRHPTEPITHELMKPLSDPAKTWLQQTASVVTPAPTEQEILNQIRAKATTGKIQFYAPEDPYFGWLGNDSAFPVTYRGHTYVKAEDAYNERAKQQTQLLALIDPAQTTLTDDQKRTTMEEILQAKLTDHPELVPRLRATGTATITEHAPDLTHTDVFWSDGGGIDPRTGAVRGKNELGNLWRTIRSNLPPVAAP